MKSTRITLMSIRRTKTSFLFRREVFVCLIEPFEKEMELEEEL
jgi:hypothetical protein